MLVGLVFLTTVMGVVIYLTCVGKLSSWAEYLDSDALSIELGTNRFSVYWLIKALVILIGSLWLAGILSQFAETRIRRISRLRAGNKALISKVTQVAIYFGALVTATHALGFNIAALTVLGGTIGIGIGFGLQKITSNFISGMILLFEKSIEAGDIVELDGGVLGFVRKTRARYTLIETFDGKEVMVPNEEFIVKQVTNLSYSNTNGRIEIHVGISYDSDTELARDIMLDAARNHKRCLSDPEPACYMMEFADSSINLTLFFWIGDITYDRFGPRSDVMREIWRRFQESGISIPFPQRDLHIVSGPEVSLQTGGNT